jgi:hypothetical protein
LEVAAERGYEAEIHADALTESPDFILRDIESGSDSDPEVIRQYRTFVIEPWGSGELTVPPIEIVFTDEEEKEYTLSTDPVTVKVTGMPDDADLEIRDIAGPRELPDRPLPPVVYATAAGLLLAAGGIVLIMRRKRPEPPPVPPRERALRQLRELADRNLIEQGAFEEFYCEITWIIRTFISGEFGINAPEQTSEEFLADMENSPSFPGRFRPQLRQYMDHCDKVKYAAAVPDSSEIQKVFSVTRDFIVNASVPGDREGEEKSSP